MGKQTKPKRKGDGGPSTVSVVAAGAVVVLVAAWFGTRKEIDQDVGEEETEDEPDERLQIVREALFSPEGTASTENRPKPRFANKEYWEQRYKSTKREHFDWYGTWASASSVTIKPHVVSHFPSNVGSILNIGCGNSRMPQELADDGYPEVISIDISDAAVEKMAATFAHIPGLKFLQMDATKMTFQDNSFDVVFEKGTLDALYTGSVELVKQVISEVYRVLRPGGIFVSVTFGDPGSRTDLNMTSKLIAQEQSAAGWSRFHTVVLERNEISESSHNSYYIYIMTKPNVE